MNLTGLKLISLYLLITEASSSPLSLYRRHGNENHSTMSNMNNNNPMESNSDAGHSMMSNMATNQPCDHSKLQRRHGEEGHSSMPGMESMTNMEEMPTMNNNSPMGSQSNQDHSNMSEMNIKQPCDHSKLQRRHGEEDHSSMPGMESMTNMEEMPTMNNNSPMGSQSNQDHSNMSEMNIKQPCDHSKLQRRHGDENHVNMPNEAFMQNMDTMEDMPDMPGMENMASDSAPMESTMMSGDASMENMPNIPSMSQNTEMNGNMMSGDAAIKNMGDNSASMPNMAAFSAPIESQTTEDHSNMANMDIKTPCKHSKLQRRHGDEDHSAMPMPNKAVAQDHSNMPMPNKAVTQDHSNMPMPNNAPMAAVTMSDKIEDYPIYTNSNGIYKCKADYGVDSRNNNQNDNNNKNNNNNQNKYPTNPNYEGSNQNNNKYPANPTYNNIDESKQSQDQKADTQIGHGTAGEGKKGIDMSKMKMPAVKIPIVGDPLSMVDPRYLLKWVIPKI
ncbi:hypothetical protein K502DRAFT_364219 [Neoconidiobolus thromboides FSU 785]|nr:hypothetical protein K502DRAFT_364219 [Neoconidiobolus thromboides FSU 785]